MLGVLEDTPGIYGGDPNYRSVRVVFYKEGSDWKPFPNNCLDQDCLKSVAAKYPRELTWTIAFDGKRLGEVTGRTPDDFRYCSDIGKQKITSSGRVPTVGARSEEFGGFLFKPVYRPLIAISRPFFSDPDHWKPTQLPAETLLTVRQQFRKKFPTIFLLGLYYFLVMCGWWIVLLWAPTFLVTTKHFSLSLGGTIASYLGFAGAIGGLSLGRYCDLGTLKRTKTTLIVLTIMSAVLMAGLDLNIPTWLTGVTMFALGFLGYPLTPILLSVVSQIIPKSITGSAIGFVLNFGMLGGAVSPLALGMLTGRFGMSTIWLWAAVVLGISSLCLFVASSFKQSAA